MKKRRVEVLIETHQTLIIRSPGRQASDWCSECAATTRMITADEAARLVRQTTRAIYRLVEARRLHYRETPVGSLLVCLGSLLASADCAEQRVTEILAAPEPEGGAIRS